MRRRAGFVSSGRTRRERRARPEDESIWVNAADYQAEKHDEMGRNDGRRRDVVLVASCFSAARINGRLIMVVESYTPEEDGISLSLYLSLASGKIVLLARAFTILQEHL